MEPWASPAYFLRWVTGRGMKFVRGEGSRARLVVGTDFAGGEAAWAGRETISTVVVERERSWWAGWSAVGLWCAAAGVFGLWGGAVADSASCGAAHGNWSSWLEERTLQLREAQKARENFFATLSHEIRNPLNGVVGLCTILKEAPAGAIAARERLFVRQLYGVCRAVARHGRRRPGLLTKFDRGLITLNAEMLNE